MKRALTVILVTGILISGCASASTVISTTPQATVAPRPGPSPVPPTLLPPTTTPVPATPTPTPLRVWIDPAVPITVQEQVAAATATMDTVPAVSMADSDLFIGPDLPVPLARWVYALVVPFPTLADEVSWSAIQAFWAGELNSLSAISGDATPPTLFVEGDTLQALRALLGPPAETVPITVTSGLQLVDLAWAARPHALAVVPFEELETHWKVLAIDGMNVLARPLDVDKYPLTLHVGAKGKSAGTVAATLGATTTRITNRDEGQLLTVIMTGVTAMVRGIGYRMEKYGVLYPAEHIGEVLKAADVLHINNEVPFASNCPPSDPNTESLTFCSRPDFIELLEAVGTDVVELTGNHAMDYGKQAMLDTLEMYRARGWPYFGGGADLKDAQKAITLEKNGTVLGFIGCNPVGPDFAWATANGPGAAPCDDANNQNELATLKHRADVTIATMQYWETYQYEPTWKQVEDFRALVDAGADIVSGSQSHQPQAIEFYHGGFIHYGLGNLFFDQMWSLGTRQELIDRHVIYMGRHISTELLSYMLEDYSQPRLMTAKERQQVLQSVFEASGW
jgi:hypothetical protein